MKPANKNPQALTPFQQTTILKSVAFVVESCARDLDCSKHANLVQLENKAKAVAAVLRDACTYINRADVRRPRRT